MQEPPPDRPTNDRPRDGLIRLIAIERVPNADGDEGYRLSVDTEPTSSVEQRNESKSRELVVVGPKGRTLLAYLLYPPVLARLGSFFEPRFSFPPLPVPTVQNRPMEYSQVVRHRFLVPACKGSNPFTPDYEHPIGSVKNEPTTTREAVNAVPEPASQKFDLNLPLLREEREGKDRWRKKSFQPRN
ncbi:hypothetical protein RND71_040502 [Anisodus tanguticus]|uniref:Uncharacterized protein n=1 Tax=Anisodus tanguticus TaxID=243964 RepID=A0AAE1UVS6_9SOLA|nr:hypothetical protein RND71_040502 [Anisodus tanguticus]